MLTLPSPPTPTAAAAARLLGGAAGAPGLVEAIQARLDTLVGRPSGFVDTLPRAVRARVRFLQALQSQYDDLEEEYKRELDELDRKYDALYGESWRKGRRGGERKGRLFFKQKTHQPTLTHPPAPLFAKRAAVVKGQEDAPPDVVEATPPGDADDADGGAAPAGVPQFWAGALRAHDLLGNQITEKDEEVLAHLIDVRCEELDGKKEEEEEGDDDDSPHGFRITFEFEPNDFFDGTLLTMTYHMDPDDDGMLERVEGTRIAWKPGKDVTVKRLKRKPKPGRGGRAAAAAAPQYKVEPVDSFFHWFAPPAVPDDGDDASDDEVEALQAALEESFEIAEALRDEVIPNAVSFYTGDAVAVSEDEEDDDEDDDDDDDESHSDEDESESGSDGGGAGKKRAPPRAPTDAAGDKPAECKQQ